MSHHPGYQRNRRRRCARLEPPARDRQCSMMTASCACIPETLIKLLQAIDIEVFACRFLTIGGSMYFSMKVIGHSHEVNETVKSDLITSRYIEILTSTSDIDPNAMLRKWFLIPSHEQFPRRKER